MECFRVLHEICVCPEIFVFLFCSLELLSHFRLTGTKHWVETTIPETVKTSGQITEFSLHIVMIPLPNKTSGPGCFRLEVTGVAAVVMDVKMPDKEGFADRVAELCYRRYAQLPKKGKPQEGKEWTLMAAVVLETSEGCLIRDLKKK